MMVIYHLSLLANSLWLPQCRWRTLSVQLGAWNSALFLDVVSRGFIPILILKHHSLSHTRSPSFALFPRRHSAIHHTHYSKGFTHTLFFHRAPWTSGVSQCRWPNQQGNSHKTPAVSKCSLFFLAFHLWYFSRFRICCWLVRYWVVLECLFLCDHDMSPSSRIPFTSETCLSADYFINPSASSDSFIASPQITVVLLHLIHWFSFS